MPADRITVTVTERIHVARTPDEVFDYTQDYGTRPLWDPTVKSAQVIGEDPREVRMDLEGVGPVTLRYQLYRRGERTSAAFKAEGSRLVLGGGGSWDYAPSGGGTDWTQTSTLELKPGLTGRLMAPLIRRNMGTMMRKSMATAKEIMEAAGAAEPAEPAAPIGG